MDNGREERNIVMFPFMALARLLERKEGYIVTIVNTPLNIQRLGPSLPSKTNIRLAEIPFHGTNYGLQPGVENTRTLTAELTCCMLEDSENLESPFKSLLINITEQDSRVPEFLLPDFPEASKIQQSQLENDFRLTDSTNALWLFRTRRFSHCFCSDAILLNTMEGLRDIGVKHFRRKMGGKPVWMIGPACSSMKNDAYNQEERSEKRSSKTDSCCERLDLNPPASVLYVSFGSHNTILPSQMMELALSLEASNKAFIWVIRPPFGFSSTEDFRAE
ncbi:UDP-glycosyltransferase 92A1 [Quercus suber]|uniref:UDP-glycosyltransferase 92A1 n=1 Tax=Quercus suber TaxID=58331 RepID=UPI000CE1A150|nr:UDP-glycosyltransferase 92A1-like [Quercus suber]POE65840.1 udp-glycosyltransferase 92a1 [Quercus suber]